MDCKQVEQILMDYIYEEIDPAEVETIETHLKACSRCAEEVESFQQTRSMVGVFEQLEPPAAVTQLLIEEAQRAAPSQQSFFARLRSMMRVLLMHPALSAAAMLVVVLGVSFFAYRKGLPPAERDVPVTDTPELPLGDPAHRATLRVPAGSAEEGSADKKRQEQKVALGGLRQQAPNNAPALQKPAMGRGWKRADQADRNLGDREKEDGLRTTGPTKLEVALGATKRARRPRPRAAPKTAYPAVQKAPDRDATYDQLAKQGEAAGKGAGTASAEVVRGTAPKKKARRSSPLRRRTRRAAAVSNVGSGSTGVWSGRRAGQPAAPASTKSNKADDAYEVDGNSLGAKVSRDKKLLLAGRRFVRAGKCESAFSYFVKVLKVQPALIDRVAVELTPCVPQLQASKRHQGLAKRVQRSQVRRRRAAAKARARKIPARATQQPVKTKAAH